MTPSARAGTLFLSDLDGTLLRSDTRLSAYTAGVVNGFVRSGALFSYATARSLETSLRVTEGIEVALPVIVHNGTFIVDRATGAPLWSLRFTREEREEIFGCFRRHGLFPIVYTVLGGKNRFSFYRKLCSEAQWRFILSRFGDERNREIFAEEQALDGEVYYFACIDREEKLAAVCKELENKYRCIFSRDIYTGDPWLDVMHRDASKATAAVKLKELLHCDRLVCFGDEINDIPMFAVADESYAVANAAEGLKRVATGVIGSNDGDGVARFLQMYLQKYA